MSHLTAMQMWSIGSSELLANQRMKIQKNRIIVTALAAIIIWVISII